MRRPLVRSYAGLLLLLLASVVPAPVSASTGSGDIQLYALVPKAAPAAKPMPLQGKATTMQLQGKAEILDQPSLTEMSALPAVDRCLPFKGYVARLADGTKLAALRNDRLFEGDARRFIPELATVDLSNDYIKGAVYKAFLKMNCLEAAALGANYYTAPAFYESFHYGGRNIAIGASSRVESPVIKMMLGGVLYIVKMDLPGLNSGSHNVMVITDGQHVLSIDPKTSEAWMLATVSKVPRQLRWLKLTHNRGISIDPSKKGI